MNSIPFKGLLGTVFFVCVSHIANAQLNPSKYEIGITAGTFVYQGDLSPSAIGSLQLLQPGLTLFGVKNLGQSFSIRANFAIGKLSADESNYSSPAYHQLRA